MSSITSCFLPTVYKTAFPFLHGVSRVVPPVQQYYETLRLFAADFAALRFFRLAIPSFRFVPFFRPRQPRTQAADQPEIGKPGLQPAVPMEMARSPKFPRNPSDHSPCSKIPARPGTLAGPNVANAWHGRRVTQVRWLSTNNAISGLNRTAFDLVVYVSQ